MPVYTERKKYNTAEMDKCEYVEEMKKVYFGTPVHKNGKCAGFKNKYTNEPSNVCKQCKNFGDENEF